MQYLFADFSLWELEWWDGYLLTFQFSQKVFTAAIWASQWSSTSSSVWYYVGDVLLLNTNDIWDIILQSYLWILQLYILDYFFYEEYMTST